MNEVLLLNKVTDKDPVTGTPIRDLCFEWTDFYGQAKSNEGRYYQILAPSYDKSHPGADNFKAMEANPDLCVTRAK